jgi:hypothetical protein
MIPVNFAKGWVRFAPFTINFLKENFTNNNNFISECARDLTRAVPHVPLVFFVLVLKLPSTEAIVVVKK